MKTTNRQRQQVPKNTDGWMKFPGGELEGQRPRALCRACREDLRRAVNAGDKASGASVSRRALCFGCYRAGLDRNAALLAAGGLDTASEERFQTGLPFEPVNVQRLGMLKAERQASRVIDREGVGRFANKRHQAQIAARRAISTALLPGRSSSGMLNDRATPLAHLTAMSAIHAAELQLPESWLPFVVAG